MNTNITKTIQTITTWRNEQTNERIEYCTDSQSFYIWDEGGRLTASIDRKEADWALKLCDLAVSNDKHTLELAGKDFVPNTLFLSMVLSQFLHVPKVDTIHKDSNHN